MLVFDCTTEIYESANIIQLGEDEVEEVLLLTPKSTKVPAARPYSTIDSPSSPLPGGNSNSSPCITSKSTGSGGKIARLGHNCVGTPNPSPCITPKSTRTGGKFASNGLDCAGTKADEISFAGRSTAELGKFELSPTSLETACILEGPHMRSKTLGKGSGSKRHEVVTRLEPESPIHMDGQEIEEEHHDGDPPDFED